MNLIKQPLTTGFGGRPHDDLDSLLRAFYRSEMPDPWPVLKPPTETQKPSPAPRRWSLSASRWALAASVLVALIGYLTLSEKYPVYSDSNAGITFGSPTATRHKPKVKFNYLKLEVEESIGPDGKMVPRVRSLTVGTEEGKGQ
jgi:hypothetical protein